MEDSIMRKCPVVGVFDTGRGGLAVLRSIVEAAPDAEYLYFADLARFPYGTRSREQVTRFTTECALYLQQLGAELLVLACDTSSAIALDEVRDVLRVPVIGMIDPAAELAAEISRTRAALVIGTRATTESHALGSALAKRGIRAYEKECTLLPPFIEEGWLDRQVTEKVARIYLEEGLLFSPADTDILVLGCTHFPLILPMLRRIVPPEIMLVDPAIQVAKLVARAVNASTGPVAGHSKIRIYATDGIPKFRELAPLTLGQTVELVQLVHIEELQSAQIP
jgi:glutamate racemase